MKSSTIEVTQKHLANGIAQAVIANSGNANTCNADGVEVAEKMCEIAADTLGVNSDDVIVASTGVIGQPLPIERVEYGAKLLKGKLSKDGGTNAAEAIMTTDTVQKGNGYGNDFGRKKGHRRRNCKGHCGMIHINMGTMLSFVTTERRSFRGNAQRGAQRGC